MASMRLGQRQLHLRARLWHGARRPHGQQPQRAHAPAHQPHAPHHSRARCRALRLAQPPDRVPGVPVHTRLTSGHAIAPVRANCQSSELRREERGPEILDAMPLVGLASALPDAPPGDLSLLAQGLSVRMPRRCLVCTRAAPRRPSASATSRPRLKTRLLVDPGTPGTLRAWVCESAYELAITVVF